MRYSIITPVYRVEKYLDQYLDSLVRQTIGFTSHIQLILVDDGSDDCSPEIGGSWAARFPENITYLRKENRGLSSARNHGITYARGTWVTFCDPDDFLCPTYFEHVERALTQCDGETPSLIGCRPIFYWEAKDTYSDTHPLTYKFRHGVRVSDLDATSKPELQLQAASTLFRLDNLRALGLGFRDIRPKLLPDRAWQPERWHVRILRVTSGEEGMQNLRGYYLLPQSRRCFNPLRILLIRPELSMNYASKTDLGTCVYRHPQESGNIQSRLNLAIFCIE